MTAHALYNNILNEPAHTISYSDNSAEGPLAHDWRLFDGWLPGVVTDVDITADSGLGNTDTINAFCIFGHNLGSNGSTVRLQQSIDAAAWVTVATVTPADDLPIFYVHSSEVTDRAFRVLIEDSALENYCAQIAIGLALQLKPLSVGFKPPAWEKFKATNNLSRAGNFLGRSVAHEPARLVISQKLITDAELYADFKPWVSHAMRLPFFFSWDTANHSDDAVFCWTDKGGPDPVYSQLCSLSISMKVNAVRYDSL